MPAKGGFYITFEPARRELLREVAEYKDRFTVELSASDWPSITKDFFLVSFSENKELIEGACISRRKKGPRNTGGYNIEFSNFVQFEPLALSSLLSHLSKSSRFTIKDREENRGKWFPPAAWAELFQFLKEIRPHEAPALDSLWKQVNEREQIEIGNHVEMLALQRDAIGVSLDIAGLAEIRRQEFRKNLDTDTSEVNSFIELMDSQAPQERMLLDHDRHILQGVVAKGEYDQAYFNDGPRELRVWVVDKGPIEKFSGVDLVIINQTYNNLLLVQYKCMEQEEAKPLKQWRFRPNTQFNIELARMQKVNNLITAIAPSPPKMSDIRLNSESLYFKYCKRLPLSKQEGELAEGMFMSLSTTTIFLNSSASLGPKNGRYIGYDNCDRYLNNSVFTGLARDGWIGTFGLTNANYKTILGLLKNDETQSLVIAQTNTINPKF